ncbi:MAG: hypothetical protein NPMRTH1_760014 [Nitrosopumilales archaeon]|nr:MAG: hypothetical protein NPMRTH1_760014 [Nitrosopumilales archaeon]
MVRVLTDSLLILLAPIGIHHRDLQNWFTLIVEIAFGIIMALIVYYVSHKPKKFSQY